MLGFQIRCRNGVKSKDGEQKLIVGAESPSRESLGTSVEVQTGNSVEAYSIQGVNSAAHHRTQEKARAQALKWKVDQKQLLSFHSYMLELCNAKKMW